MTHQGLRPVLLASSTLHLAMFHPESANEGKKRLVPGLLLLDSLLKKGVFLNDTELKDPPIQTRPERFS